MNCANSFCFYVYLMLHACAARFDVTENLEKFCELNRPEPPTPTAVWALHSYRARAMRLRWLSPATAWRRGHGQPASPARVFYLAPRRGAHWQKLEPRAVEDGLAGGRAPPPVASRMPLFACPIRRPRPFKAFRFCARLAGGRK